MTDFIFMVKDTSYMYTGPDVLKSVINEEVSHEELGGYRVHALKNGVADGAFDNDLEALTQVRRLVDFLPASNREAAGARAVRRAEPRRALAGHPGPRQPQQALRHEGVDPEGRRQGPTS